jgi:hypothetical protein
MNRFVEKYSRKLLGVISGFDRLVLKGTLRPLSYTAGMMNFLFEREVLLKDFGAYAQQVSEQLKEASQQEAGRLGRTNRYLESSQRRKEPIARKIAEKEGINEGLICLLRTVEPCMSYDIYRDRQAQRLELRKRQRKCLWIYHYWMDRRWGQMSARIQTWFPFDIYVCLNGREWLARQMDRAGMKYRREENCFLWIEDPEGIQHVEDGWLRRVEADDHGVRIRGLQLGEGLGHRQVLGPGLRLRHPPDVPDDVLGRHRATAVELHPPTELERELLVVWAHPPGFRQLGLRLVLRVQADEGVEERVDDRVVLVGDGVDAGGVEVELLADAEHPAPLGRPGGGRCGVTRRGSHCLPRQEGRSADPEQAERLPARVAGRSER